MLLLLLLLLWSLALVDAAVAVLKFEWTDRHFKACFLSTNSDSYFLQAVATADEFPPIYHLSLFFIIPIALVIGMCHDVVPVRALKAAVNDKNFLLYLIGTCLFSVVFSYAIYLQVGNNGPVGWYTMFSGKPFKINSSEGGWATDYFVAIGVFYKACGSLKKGSWDAASANFFTACAFYFGGVVHQYHHRRLGHDNPDPEFYAFMSAAYQCQSLGVLCVYQSINRVHFKEWWWLMDLARLLISLLLIQSLIGITLTMHLLGSQKTPSEVDPFFATCEDIYLVSEFLVIVIHPLFYLGYLISAHKTNTGCLTKALAFIFIALGDWGLYVSAAIAYHKGILDDISDDQQDQGSRLFHIVSFLAAYTYADGADVYE